MSETSDELRKRLDREDYANELAGLETGRMPRFGLSTARTHEIQEKKRKEAAFRDALERLLLSDPEYRRMYEDLGAKLGEAESQTDETIIALQTALENEQENIQIMLDKAPKFDGKAIFPTADGAVVDEDGYVIEGLSADDINWPEGSATADDYSAAQDRQKSLTDDLNSWLSYRNDTLGGIRDRYDDRDNPMSKEDIRDALQKLEDQTPNLNTLASPSEEAQAPEIATAANVLSGISLNTP